MRAEPDLVSENAALRERLDEAEAVLAALRSGSVDALVTGAPGAHNVFTLEGAETPYRAFVEAMHEGAATVDASGCLLYANEALARLLERPLKTVIGTLAREMAVACDRAALDALLRPDAAAGVPQQIDLAGGDGSGRPALVTATPLGGTEGRVALVVSDLRERERGALARSQLEQSERSRRALLSLLEDQLRVEQSLRAGEQTFQAITGATMDAVILMDGTGRITFWNASAERMLGYTAEEAVGAELHRLVVPARYYDAFAGGFARFVGDGGGAVIGHVVEMHALRKGGEELPVELAISAVRLHGRWCAAGFVRDISERLARQHAIERANRALRTLSAGNEALVRAADEDGLIAQMTRILCDIGGYPMAFVGYALDDAPCSIEPRGCTGIDPAALAAGPLTWRDDAHGQHGLARALRLGRTQLMRAGEAVQGPPCGPRVFQHWPGLLALPLRLAAGERPLAAVVIAAADDESFDAAEVQLLEELAANLAYGVSNLRARAAQRIDIAERRRAQETLHAALVSTIDAIAATVEMRDPYTAGHQRRVAALAAAIAREMGLAEPAVEGIHFGALIHDLGKVQVPAELLSKPTRLSKLEFELIKTHAQAGYEIVKDIRFPWPVAEMVHQHHERIDGSGYPQGLKGDAIALEARILAVADMVEAMSSHRPYRAGLGIEAALAEVEARRGSWLDPQAVDACLRVFRTHGFSWDKS
ncbi:PAS domain S-box protein [Aquincola sp. S2]|uniref:PAS domain S-box protein n=1 Tax=Pseudaquabacterium terrae TaxID=2732868 RepID=A0ABX2EQZ6_9BURK|nr:HD domain-containing phosphohydrolase [Aquabacterium terrae]NRF71104.1 PAS domain S-box protein [Aquabacterium terrae]